MGKKTGTQLRGSKFLQAQDSLRDDFDNDQILTLVERRLKESTKGKVVPAAVERSISPSEQGSCAETINMHEETQEYSDAEEFYGELADSAGEIEEALLKDGGIGNNKLSQLYQALRRQGNDANIAEKTSQSAIPEQVQGSKVDARQVKMLGQGELCPEHFSFWH